MEVKPGIRATGYGVLLLVVLVALEGFSLGAGKYLQKRGILYEPVPGDAYETYLTARDPLLGWPAPEKFGRGGYDPDGARFSPAFPNPARYPACISLYGDSFTWATEVDDERAWGNLLARRAGCRVANYGVAGYGTDQAYLRFRSHEADSAGVVVLGVMSENILRNVMQFKDLIYPKEFYSLKPRFVLGDRGELELVPMPRIPAERYGEFVEHPERFLARDFFVPGGSSRVGRLRFPYTLSVARVCGNLIWYRMLLGEPVVDVVYADFYREDHPSQALEITAEIVTAFHADGVKGGRLPVVVVFPERSSLENYLEDGVWGYENLLVKLTERGIDAVNFGDRLVEGLGEREPEALFKAGEHYGEEVNRWIAEVVYEYVEGHGGLRSSGSMR